MATLGALTLAPGPLVAVLAARSASQDRAGACALAIGICAGDVLVVLAICAGPGFWLQAHPGIFTVGKYAGVGLLLWTAFRMWSAPVTPTDQPEPTCGIISSALVGLAICLGSPQTVVRHLVLLPRVIDLAVMRAHERLMLIAATITALLGVFFLVIFFVDMMQKLLRSSAGMVLWAATAGSPRRWRGPQARHSRRPRPPRFRR
ncbi:LysE family translocator [Paracoccus sp. (in: a-proteobacteria)]|uniref:LysE family translocator n=1 Tax=Paracoccus sp. TaxID=267 RepID=UPI0026E0FA15|nr:LysE family transporter [Paracoccus sp. (in: a-proteobacteria)]MDO5371720.1 LysE family transporter [Paracoccus sp. (in: a-proteobacteria)]